MWHTKPPAEALRHFATDPQSGLSAPDAASRLKKHGFNALLAKKKRSLLSKVAAQLSDFLVIVLLAAAAVSLGVSVLSGEADFLDPALILLIVVTNAIMGVVQESKAEKAIDALKQLSAPRSKVRRDGEIIEIESRLIVPGDILVLESGDSVGADARVIKSTGLRAEESLLTGESTPVNKSADIVPDKRAAIADMRCMVFSGSLIVAGRCEAVVTGTGMDTQVGRIAELLDESEPPPTPLQRRLNVTGKRLGAVCIIACLAVFAIGLAQNTPPLDSFMLSVSLAVAAIPEGLPAIVTIVLALGVTRMAGRGSIIRSLPAVETLGSATVICSDKTGTLTLNKMTVVRSRDSSGGEPSYESLEKLYSYAALCTNCAVSHTDGAVSGDPTEAAIVIKAQELGLSKESLDAEYPRALEIPFDSQRKRMTTVHRVQGGWLAITKGAPDVLLKMCENADSAGILAANDAMAGEALRVIAVAAKRLSAPPSGAAPDTLEAGLTFVGLIAMMDPPRPEAARAVFVCRQAGIRPIMITGDHAATASAIAKNLGILTTGGLVVTGAEMADMSDSKLKSTVNRAQVFARVSPEHKSRIIKALQSNGEIVAMTGDGVNDAPALKLADIGCAMGKSGTDVARGASDMILTDDNFSTIVAAVREGRGVYANICKAVHFLLSCNIGEILTILTATALGMPAPLLPIQLLWVNMVTDSLPALALGVEPPDADSMTKPPVKPGGSLFGEGRAPAITVQGLMIGALAIAAYAYGILSGGLTTGRTCAFAVLSLSQLVHAYNVRSRDSVFKAGIFKNKKMNVAFVVCSIMQISVICVPFVAEVFGVVPLNAAQWSAVAALSLLPLALVEAGKLIKRLAAGRGR